jgi:hypothetical protein
MPRLRSAVPLVVLTVSLAAHASRQYGPFPSNSRVTVSGPGVAAESWNLTTLYGEWYITPKDAHAVLTLINADPWPRSLSFFVQLDGKATTQTITRTNNSASVGPGRLGFGFNLPGGKQTLVLGKANAVTVTITRFDDLSFEATVTGTTTVLETGAGPVQISGTISLHRTAHAEKRSGSWIECDPVIHDAYATVIPRSASECETKYDLHVRQALNQALEPVIRAMEAKQWVLRVYPDLKLVDNEMRGSETSPYEAGATLDFYLARSSPVWQHNQQVLDDATAKMKTQLNGASAYSNPELMKKMAMEMAANTLPTAFSLKTLINLPNAEVVNFSTRHTVAELPGIGTEIYFEDGQPPTGGGEGAPVTWVLVGSWLPPVFEPLGDHEKAVFKGGLNPAKPLMSAQNYHVTIYATREIAQEVIKLIDWAPVKGLLEEK